MRLPASVLRLLRATHIDRLADEARLIGADAVAQLPSLPRLPAVPALLRPHHSDDAVNLEKAARRRIDRDRSAIVDCAIYVAGKRLDEEADPVEALRVARQLGGYVWIGLHEPSARELDGIASAFGLHPLAVEDAVTAHQRPKIDVYDAMTFTVLKTVTYVAHDTVTDTSQIVETGEVMVFVGDHFVVTVRHGDHGSLRGLRRQLETRHERLVPGPYSVLHAVADRIVDDYVAVTESVQTDVDELEASVLSPQRTRDIERIYQLKREVLELKRAVAPLVLPLKLFVDRHQRDGHPLVSYFRDVEDHLVRARDEVAAYDDLLDSILQVAFAQTQIAENEDMRKISAWVAIAAVPTMVAGIYGMNFDNMPELSWRYGYYAVLTLIATSCGVLYRGFKRNGWL